MVSTSSKWITGTKPQQLTTEVARQVLHERHVTVWHYARLAAKSWKDDIEYVHQLRVATRRARAALHIFRDLLPKHDRRRMKKLLSKLRQASGDARDLDVLGGRMRGIVEQNKSSHLVPVVAQIDASRRKAQKQVNSSYRKAKRKDFTTRSIALKDAAVWRHTTPEPTFAVVARMTLAPLVDDFFTLAREDLSDIDALHLMRISGKQVRYAMELLAGAFDDSFRNDLYETFEDVQEKLGEINDHATAITMFDQWYGRANYNGIRCEMAELIAAEEKQLDVKCQAFRDWWTATRATKLAQRFATVLQTSASST